MDLCFCYCLFNWVFIIVFLVKPKSIGSVARSSPRFQLIWVFSLFVFLGKPKSIGFFLFVFLVKPQSIGSVARSSPRFQLILVFFIVCFFGETQINWKRGSFLATLPIDLGFFIVCFFGETQINWVFSLFVFLVKPKSIRFGFYYCIVLPRHAYK